MRAERTWTRAVGPDSVGVDVPVEADEVAGVLPGAAGARGEGLRKGRREGWWGSVNLVEKC